MTITDDLVDAPTQRIALGKLAPDFYAAMIALDKAAAAGLDPVVSELVRVRASQLNKCAFCVDQHGTDAVKAGVEPRHLVALDAWRETPFFTARQRAALALVEEITALGEHGVSDEVFDEARAQFDDREFGHLVAMCVTINAWNRIGVTSRMSPSR